MFRCPYCQLNVCACSSKRQHIPLVALRRDVVVTSPPIIPAEPQWSPYNQQQKDSK